MIIRSQSRKCLINLDNISQILIQENNRKFEMFAYGYDRSKWIGDYSTEEKAIKVLDMIQNAYVGGVQMVISSNDEISLHSMPIVFQMPQDSEV